MIGGNPASALQPRPSPFVGSSTGLTWEFLFLLHGLVVVFACLELLQESHIDSRIRTRRHNRISLRVQAIRAIDNYLVSSSFWGLGPALEGNRPV